MTTGYLKPYVCSHCGAPGSGGNCANCGVANWIPAPPPAPNDNFRDRTTTSADWRAAFGRPASLGSRLAARLIDLGIVISGSFILGWLSRQLGAWPFTILIGLISYFFIVGYEFAMITKYGQTVGKKVMGLQVVRVDGSKLDAGSVAIRVFLPIGVTVVTFGLGGILFGLSPLFDQKTGWHRGWYDKLATTLVVVGR